MVIGCADIKLVPLLLDPQSPPVELKPQESKDLANQLELNP